MGRADAAAVPRSRGPGAIASGGGRSVITMAAPLDGARILVTGGSGFIGVSVIASLKEAGAEVRNVDRRPPAGDVPTVLGDLRDPGVVDRAVTNDLDGVIHLAARTSVLESVRHPSETTDENVVVTAALLERARREGARQPDLGLVEGLDRHHHRSGGRHRRAAYRRGVPTTPAAVSGRRLR